MSDSRTPPPSPSPDRIRSSGRSAAVVGAGILLSRLSGLVREVGLRRWLGTTTPEADSFAAALIIPQLIQNLLGEGSLSASFIPVYARLIEDGDDEEAGRVAGAVFTMLVVVTALLVLIGLFLAGPLVALIAPGYSGTKAALTEELLRITIGGVGLIVLAAWCLGVLNAHRQFFLSYVAPVVWNIIIIAAVAFAGLRHWAIDDVARAASWGVLVGGLAQFLIQIPAVLKVAPRLRLGFARHDPAVGTVLRRFGPAVLGRGVVTLSTWIDLALASLLVTGAAAALGPAQVLYLMPISAFALSIAAAELPELSRGSGSSDEYASRIRVGFDRLSFFLVFSLVVYLTVGRYIVAALFQGGATTSDDTILIWLILAVYALGMPASGASRLLQAARYAAGDVGGPARIAAVRVAIAAVVGVVAMLQLDRYGVISGDIVRLGDLPAFRPLPDAVRNSGDTVRLGAMGLALGATVGAWAELAMLQRRVDRDVAGAPKLRTAIAPLVTPAILAGATAFVLTIATGSLPSLVIAVVSAGLAGLVYLVVANLTGSRTAIELLSPVLKRLP